MMTDSSQTHGRYTAPSFSTWIFAETLDKSRRRVSLRLEPLRFQDHPLKLNATKSRLGKQSKENPDSFSVRRELFQQCVTAGGIVGHVGLWKRAPSL